jgi:Protein of unknown function (DUF3175)
MTKGPAGRSAAARKAARPTRKARIRKWSQAVMQRSNALDLEPGVFTKRSAKAIAQSLKRSALASRRRKADPFRSAMSMLNFHINRGGKGLSAERRRVLNRAKDELRAVFGRSSQPTHPVRSRAVRRSPLRAASGRGPSSRDCGAD